MNSNNFFSFNISLSSNTHETLDGCTMSRGPVPSGPRSADGLVVSRGPVPSGPRNADGLVVSRGPVPSGPRNN